MKREDPARIALLEGLAAVPWRRLDRIETNRVLDLWNDFNRPQGQTQPAVAVLPGA